MSLRALYPSTGDTWNNGTIIDAYQNAYLELYNRQPTECRYVEGNWFVVNGIYRERTWVMSEIDRLRDLALERSSRRQHQQGTEQKGAILRLIKRLSGL